ncbi:hypothetical protein CRE_24091 [Caenorhabditis remanei]|uniref:Uncharacterized protein n=1 Tax=Caenorhabditis remanei TaxID=31234 RepID=E3MVJ0_CAERE|nr:hypothetical protein CRE_24091 [Caenorhabditis remanei]
MTFMTKSSVMCFHCTSFLSQNKAFNPLSHIINKKEIKIKLYIIKNGKSKSEPMSYILLINIPSCQKNKKSKNPRCECRSLVEKYPYAHYSPKIIKYLCLDRLLIEHGPCNPPFNLLIVFFQLILTGRKQYNYKTPTQTCVGRKKIKRILKKDPANAPGRVSKK